MWINHDLAAFAGLVLATDPNNTTNLYGGIWAQGSSTVYTVVEPYFTETVDGVLYKYYPNAVGGYHVRASRSGYIPLYKNIYMTQEESTTRTVETITLEKKGTDGFVPPVFYSHTTEVLSNKEAWKSEASMYPKYEDALDIPVFEAGKDPHQMTTQKELEADLAAQDQPNDDMYVFNLGKSEAYGHNIPVVIFTQSDLSGATTVEQAAKLIDQNKLTVYYRAQMHGNEPGGGEGALGMIHYLQDGYGDDILDKLNVIIVPRLNPDGSELYQRLLPNSINPNRDQMLLESAEMQAFQTGYLLFDPEIVIDGHERVWNNSAGDIQVSASFTPMNSDAFRTTALRLDDAAFEELERNGLCGYYYSTVLNDNDPNMGGAYYAGAGCIYVLMESRGIHGGNESMARRAVANMAAVAGMLDYLHANDEAVKRVIATERAAFVRKGATYETDDVIFLQTGTRTTTAADKDAWGFKIDCQMVDWATGEVTFPDRYPYVRDVAKRTRVAPTAYVIPAGESWTEAALAHMDKHGISYTFLPAGATLQLQRYGGTTTEATLGAETATRFAKGCYVFAMNQEKALLLAMFMEPDHTNSAEFKGGMVQSGKIPYVSSIYRYIRDLNALGTVDYTVTEAELVNITVYLNGTNGLDTNNGLSEDTAVKTLEKAYAVMDAALRDAEPGSAGTLVVIGLYDLGAQQSHLPAANYPVTITGKTTNDGFSFTGGTSQDTRTFEIHGDTTFRNIKLHINNKQSFNYLLGNGHKLVLDEGINTTTSATDCYFTLVGGDYDYADINNSTDITVRSGSWRTIYAGGYRASVSGLAKADISGCWVYQNIAPTYCGNVGSADLKISNTTVKSHSTSAIYLGPIAYSATTKTGSITGDTTLTLGENVSAQAVYCSSRDSGNIYGTAKVIVNGVDLSLLPVYTKLPATKGTTADALLVLAQDVTQNVTLDVTLPVDLNGHDITGNLTVNGTLSVKDSQTDDYTVADGNYGQIIGTVTGDVAAAEGYATADKRSFHRLSMRISGVSIRPSIVGIYYLGNWKCDEVLAAKVKYFGVAISAVDMPDQTFMTTDTDTLWTVFKPDAWESGKSITSVMISNILKPELDDNDARGRSDIYAAPYLVLDDGTESGKLLVTKDEAKYSLYDVMKLADEKNSAEHADKLNAFYETWKDTMSTWNLTNIGK